MKSLFLFLVTCVLLEVHSQDLDISKFSDNDFEIYENFSFNKRKNILLISESSAYTIALAGLNHLWYIDYPRSRFHFINDNGEWLQMDKVGHMSASYYMGVVGIKAYNWAGYSRKKAIWYGGMTGSFFLTIVEVLDGTSQQWGASSGDLIANSSGSLLAIVQALKWNEQRIQLKYSYSPTKWAELNPNQLGYNHLERSLKDYNGQTYWVSFNIKSLFNINHKKFPNWISVAVGYGGDSMTKPYAEDNSEVYRQYYASLDVDLNKIKTESKIVNSILHLFGFLKFPAPAFEFSKGKISYHKIYY
jgi:hypothetical protein